MYYMNRWHRHFMMSDWKIDEALTYYGALLGSPRVHITVRLGSHHSSEWDHTTVQSGIIPQFRMGSHLSSDWGHTTVHSGITPKFRMGSHHSSVWGQITVQTDIRLHFTLGSDHTSLGRLVFSLGRLVLHKSTHGPVQIGTFTYVTLSKTSTPR